MHRRPRPNLEAIAIPVSSGAAAAAVAPDVTVTLSEFRPAVATRWHVLNVFRRLLDWLQRPERPTVGVLMQVGEDAELWWRMDGSEPLKHLAFPVGAPETRPSTLKLLRPVEN